MFPLIFYSFTYHQVGHIDGISGDCDLNREKSSGTYPYGQSASLSPLTSKIYLEVVSLVLSSIISWTFRFLAHEEDQYTVMFRKY